MAIGRPRTSHKVDILMNPRTAIKKQRNGKYVCMIFRHRVQRREAKKRLALFSRQRPIFGSKSGISNSNEEEKEHEHERGVDEAPESYVM